MPRTHSTPPRPIAVHPAWGILETQGMALERIRVLTELIANGDGDGDTNVLAAIILEIVEEAERFRVMASETVTPRAGAAKSQAH